MCRRPAKLNKMLCLILPEIEGYDDVTEQFFTLPSLKIRLEHSLYSLSEWEQKYEKPFLSKTPKTNQEMLYYFHCMLLDKADDINWIKRLTKNDFDRISSYISAPMTATTIREPPGRKQNNRVLTSEVLYCYMIGLGIPFECQYWHLNRLLTLIRVCQIEFGPKQKMSNAEILNQNQKINRQRLKQYNTRG